MNNEPNNEPNIVSHLTDNFFGGVQKNFCGFVDRRQSTVATWKKGNFIPLDVQRVILEKSDMQGFGITPADFFPERLPQADEAAA